VVADGRNVGIHSTRTIALTTAFLAEISSKRTTPKANTSTLVETATYFAYLHTKGKI
jgi:hypothetical protein